MKYGLPVLVGEAPGPRGADGGKPLEGAVGRRLARLMGVSFEEYLARTERFNLLPTWPGPDESGGSRWPVGEAVAAGDRMLGTSIFWRAPCVVLLGRRVAEAFGLGDWPWWKPATLYEPEWRHPTQFARGRVTAYVVPHPSGVNRWWNDAANRESAKRFWRQFVQTYFTEERMKNQNAGTQTSALVKNPTAEQRATFEKLVREAPTAGKAWVAVRKAFPRAQWGKVRQIAQSFGYATFAKAFKQLHGNS